MKPTDQREEPAVVGLSVPSVRPLAVRHILGVYKGMRISLLPLASLAAIILLASSCVGKRKYVSAVATVDRLRADSLQLASDAQDLRTQFCGLQDDAQLTAAELEARKQELKAKDEELRIKAQRMDELDGRLRAQGDAMSSLRKKVSDALVNFKADELSVSMRDGKVYVSLSEKLLFASGSDKVDPKGKEALGKLAEVLRANADIHVMVEGHTDSIPIRTSRFVDNWDLSTARASSIVRLLTATYNVPAERVQAAGRGEFLPVASNMDQDGRARNRRTEIILMPKLDELFDLLGNE